MTEVHVNDIEFLPEVGAFQGRDADGTVYVMKLNDDDLERLHTPGDDMTHQRGCARCRFRAAIVEVLCSGEHIAKHYPVGHPERLNDADQEMLTMAYAWLADEAARRCLEESH